MKPPDRRELVMGRSVLHWVCVFALGAVPLVGCSDESSGTGGMGGDGGFGTQEPECDADPPVGCPKLPADIIGGERPATVAAPVDYDSGEDYPLVVVLHGASADSERIVEFLGADQTLIDVEQFVLVAPNGSPATDGRHPWNTGASSYDFVGEPPDDVAYMRALIEEARKKISIDPRRIYLMGYSNGAHLALDTACKDPSLVAAIVSIAGARPVDDACTEQPVSVLHVHGTEDPTVDPAGGKREVSCITIFSAEDLVAGFAARNGCDESFDTLPNIDLDNVTPDAETVVFSYPGCDDQTRTEFWSMQGVGHVPIFLDAGTGLLFDWLLSRERPE